MFKKGQIANLKNVFIISLVLIALVAVVLFFNTPTGFVTYNEGDSCTRGASPICVSEATAMQCKGTGLWGRTVWTIVDCTLENKVCLNGNCVTQTIAQAQSTSNVGASASSSIKCNEGSRMCTKGGKTLECRNNVWVNLNIPCSYEETGGVISAQQTGEKATSECISGNSICKCDENTKLCTTFECKNNVWVNKWITCNRPIGETCTSDNDCKSGNCVGAIIRDLNGNIIQKVTRVCRVKEGDENSICENDFDCKVGYTCTAGQATCDRTVKPCTDDKKTTTDICTKIELTLDKSVFSQKQRDEIKTIVNDILKNRGLI